MRAILLAMMVAVAAIGCASGGGKGTLETALSAPPGTKPEAAAANEEGITLFYKRQWEGARAQFEAAIKAQPTLAEAHYNLGLVHDVLRNDREARKHFVEAANLAPGNKEIWNSPPLRRHGDVIGGPKSGIFAPDDHRH